MTWFCFRHDQTYGVFYALWPRAGMAAPRDGCGRRTVPGRGGI